MINDFLRETFKLKKSENFNYILNVLTQFSEVVHEGKIINSVQIQILLDCFMLCIYFIFETDRDTKIL